MVDDRPNDWMLLTLDNPTFDSARFKEVGVTPDNTSLQSRDFYKNSDYIRSKFTDLSTGNFDEVKFNNWYSDAISSYNQFVTGNYEDNIYSDLEFDPMSNLRPVGSKVKTPEIRIEKVANPWRQRENTTRMGWIEDPTKTDLELASGSKVFNFSTQKYEDYTADDMSLFSDPFKFIKQIVDPLVLATWDSDGTHTDPISGKTVYHKKGENKLNEDGDFYFETLGDRPVYNKRVKSIFDSFTAESSSLNKYDFFDSDDLDKSVVGTVFKTAMLLAPMFTPIAPYYGAAMVGKEMLNILPSVYNMTIGTVTDTSPGILNRLSGISKGLTSTTSEYSLKNFISFENILNLVSDVALQLQLQRAIFNWMSKLSGASKKAAQIATLPLDLQAVEFLKFQDMIRRGNQTASNAAIAYMAMSQGLDTYTQGLELGLSKGEAALTAWGAIAGMYTIDKQGLGEIFFPELDMGKAAARNEARRVANRFAQVYESDLVKAPKSPNKLVNLWNSAKKKSYMHWSEKDNITGFWDAVKTHSLNFMGKSIGEGLEESAEEAVSDLAKSTMNLWLSFNDRKDKDGNPLRFDIWDDMVERLAMNFFGGAIGGAVFAGSEIVNGTRLSRQTKLELAYLLRNGLKGLVLDLLEHLRKKGKLGSKDLSIKDPEKDDKGDLVWQSAQSEEDSLNEAVYKATRAYILALDTAIHQGEFDLSDTDIMLKMANGSLRLELLLDKDIIKDGYEHRVLSDYKDLLEEYLNLISQLSKLNLTDKDERILTKVGTIAGQKGVSLTEAALDSNLNLTPEQQLRVQEYDKIQTRLNEVRQQREKFFSGEYAVDFLDDMLFNMDENISSAFYDPTFEIFVKSTTGKELSEFSKEELEGLQQKYIEYKNSEDGETKRKLAFEMFKLYNIKFAPQINSQIDILNKVEEITDYLRESLYDMEETLGSEEKQIVSKYALPLTLEITPLGIEHIDFVDSMLRKRLGLDTRFVLKDSVRLHYKMDEVPEVVDPNKSAEENALAIKEILETNNKIRAWNNSLKEHNDKVFKNLADIVAKIKSYGFIDLDTKNHLIELLEAIVKPMTIDLLSYDEINDLLVNVVINGNENLSEENANFDVDNISVSIPIKNILTLLEGHLHLKESDLKSKIKDIAKKEISTLDRDGLIKLLNDEDFYKLSEGSKEDQITALLASELYRNEDQFITVNEDGTISPTENLKDEHVYALWAGIRDNFLNDDLRKYVEENYKEDLERGSDKLSDLIYNLINKTALLPTSSQLNVYRTIYHDIATQESPLFDFIGKLSVAIYGKKLNIFEFLRTLDTALKLTEHILDYVLALNAALELELAKKVIAVMKSLIVASRDSKDIPELLIGHNAIVKLFAEENNLKNDYETLPIEKALNFLNEIFTLEYKLKFIEGLNDLNSANLFKEQTNTEKLSIKLLIKAFTALEEYKFLKKLTVNIEDKLYDLLEGVSSLATLDPESDLNDLRKVLTSILLKLHENLLRIVKETGKTESEILELMVGNIDPDTLQKIAKLDTSTLNSKIKHITSYDTLLFVLTSSLYDKHEFEFRLKEALTDENIAPLFTQLWSIYLGTAMFKYKKEFNAILSKIHEHAQYKYQEMLNNLIFIDGVGGAGKTSVVGKIICKIAKKNKPDLKILKCGPTSLLLEGLSKVIPNGENKTKEDFIEEILGKKQWAEIKAELTSPYSDTNKYIIKESVLDDSGEPTYNYRLNLENITIQKLDYDLVIFDEASFLNPIELKIFALAGFENNFTTILTGDSGLLYNIPDNFDAWFGNITYVDSELCIRTPKLGVNMRVLNVLKKDNSELASNLELLYFENILQLQSNTKAFKILRENAIFHYYEDELLNLYGDKLVDSLTKELLKTIISNAINLNPKSKNIFGYIWDGKNSETKVLLDLVLLENPSFKDKVKILTPKEVLGSEFDLVIVDVNFRFEDNDEKRNVNWEELKALYTFSTRGKVGVRFLNKGLSSLFTEANFVADIRTDLSPDANEIIKDYKEQFFKYLDESLEGYTPPKTTASGETSGAGSEEGVVNTELDKTFEDEITDNGLIRENIDDTSQVPNSIRSYAWYIRYGCKEENGKYTKVDYNGSYSDLNVILDVAGNNLATDDNIDQFLELKEVLASGLIDAPEVLEDLKQNTFFLSKFDGFVDSLTKGNYYIEARKVDEELDYPLLLVDADISKIKESVNIVYRFEHNGKTYTITLSKLSDPETWRRSLPTDADKTDVDAYTELYNSYINDIQNSNEPIYYQLNRKDLEFTNLGRLVPQYDENGNRIIYDLDKFTLLFPNTLLSDHLYIYDGPEDGGVLNSSLRGTRCMLLVAPLKGRALDRNGKYVKITPKNMYELYYIAKERAKEYPDQPTKCPIRAIVCNSKPLWVSDPSKEQVDAGNTRTGFFNLDVKKLVRQYGDPKLVAKHLGSLRTVTTSARIVVSLWNYMVELRHCLRAMTHDGQSIEQINAFLSGNNSIFRLRDEIDYGDTFSKVKVAQLDADDDVGKDINIVAIHPDEIKNYFDILCTFFELLLQFIDYPNSIEDIKNLKYGWDESTLKYTKHINRMSMLLQRADPNASKEERKKKAKLTQILSARLKTAKLKKVTLSEDDTANYEINTMDVHNVIHYFLIEFFRYIRGEGFSDPSKSELLKEKLTITDEEGNILASALPDLVFKAFLDAYGSGKINDETYRSSYEANKFFNILLHGMVNPDTDTLQVNVEREYEGKKHRVIPFPEGIYCRPVYDKDLNIASGSWLYAAINERDKFTSDVGYESGLINIRLGANIGLKYEKPIITPKFNVNDNVKYNDDIVTVTNVDSDEYTIRYANGNETKISIETFNLQGELISLDEDLENKKLFLVNFGLSDIDSIVTKDILEAKLADLINLILIGLNISNSDGSNYLIGYDGTNFITLFDCILGLISGNIKKIDPNPEGTEFKITTDKGIYTFKKETTNEDYITDKSELILFSANELKSKLDNTQDIINEGESYLQKITDNLSNEDKIKASSNISDLRNTLVELTEVLTSNKSDDEKDIDIQKLSNSANLIFSAMTNAGYFPVRGNSINTLIKENFLKLFTKLNDNSCNV